LHVPINGDVVVGEEVSVGHGAILHGCTIGDGSLVGMGAIVLDGAKVGRNCLIGAGALVTGRMDAPDGVLIMGSPAKIVRELTEDELESLRVNCEEYVGIGRALAEEGLL
jgi:carbonic anhydrase/acetyltransferase-like protein (isoleucine patch superfamily)